MSERIITVVFSGPEGEYDEAIVAYRHGDQLVLTGGNNVTLKFDASELLSVLTEAIETQGGTNGQ